MFAGCCCAQSQDRAFQQHTVGRKRIRSSTLRGLMQLRCTRCSGTQLYDSALAGNSSDTQFILKHRRREVYGNVGDRPQQPDFLNITLEEHLERLERLGLPLPVIESDREEDYAPDPTNANLAREVVSTFISDKAAKILG